MSVAEITVETNELEKRALQRMAALAIGNQIRYDRADFKNELKVLGKLESIPRIIEVLEQQPRFVQSLTVGSLLGFVPRLNKNSKARLLKTAACSEGRTVEKLSSRQREALVTGLAQIAGKQ